MPKLFSRLLLLAVVVVGIVFALQYREALDAAALEEWIAGFGLAGPLVFMLIYALAAVLFLPGSVMTLAGGALFGPWWGTLYNLTGATIGAGLAFLVARHLAADWVASKTGGRMKQLIDGVEQEGWRFVAFTRLVPLFPFNLLNYALGLTRIRFWHYLLATYICMLPGALAYTWLGYAGREALTGGEGMIQTILMAIALLALVAFLPRLIKRLRMRPMTRVDIATLQHSHIGSETLLLDVRDEAEYQAGHISGAIHIPLAELPTRMAELEEWRERPIAVICRTDRRSAEAVQQLLRQGYTRPLLVSEGMQGWEQASLPVEKADLTAEAQRRRGAEE
ncbi:MAG: VTT domain-containing protein [Chromatiales bacterium]|nr:VTT domain-containing protein [Chromatiales bacterium]